MITLRPYEDLAAMAVLSRLDPSDDREAGLMRGAASTPLQLFAEWRSVEAIRLASYVAFTGPDRGNKPFALFGLSNTGQGGVAAAALLARDHQVFRRPLAELVVTLRREMPGFAAERGIQRIEARSWADHPTAAQLLVALGFAHECLMPGFGGRGQARFRQFAWTPAPLQSPPPQEERI